MICNKPNTRTVPKVRQVIKGHAYDTQTASVQYHHEWVEEPASWDQPPDLYDIGSVLMLNAWGVYFALHYNHELDPWESDYERIEPLTVPEAIAWAERFCPSHVEQIFGRLPEAGEGEAYQPVT